MSLIYNSSDRPQMVHLHRIPSEFMTARMRESFLRQFVEQTADGGRDSRNKNRNDLKVIRPASGFLVKFMIILIGRTVKRYYNVMFWNWKVQSRTDNEWKIFIIMYLLLIMICRSIIYLSIRENIIPVLTEVESVDTRVYVLIFTSYSNTFT